MLGEGLAVLVYLRIVRDHGAAYVSFADDVSMDFAAALVIAAAVILRRRHDRRGEPFSRGPPSRWNGSGRTPTKGVRGPGNTVRTPSVRGPMTPARPCRGVRPLGRVPHGPPAARRRRRTAPDR